MGRAVKVLTQSDIAALMRPADYLTAVEAGFRAAFEGRASSPAPLHLAANNGGFHGKAALIENSERSYAVLKFNGNFPGNADRPTIQGLILVSDARNGTPLAVMDSIEVTLRRTAAASALAARYLARSDASVIAFCGCGAQAWPHLQALADVVPLKSGWTWDANSNKASALAARAREEFAMDLRPVRTLSEATAQADIIVTSTTASSPYLGMADVRPGTFVAAVGADAPHKSEIESALMAKARIFVDVLTQCTMMGDLHHALAANAVCEADVCGDLTDLVSGRCAGRTRPDEITLFDSTGTAIEDAASAAMIYERALARGVGTDVGFAG